MARKEKAMVAKVSIGSSLQIDGLRLPDGSYAIAVPQVADLFSIPQKNSSRDLKDLLQLDSQFLKTKSELHPKDVNIVSLYQFEVILIKLDRKQNPMAMKLRDALTGLSLDTLFCDAFGVVSDARTRQAYLDARLAGIEDRKTFTNAIESHYIDTHEGCESVPGYAFSNPSDTLNRALTGHPAKYWRERFGVDSNEALRDRWSLAHLKRIQSVEELAKRRVEVHGTDPIEAVKFAIDALCFDVWDEDKLTGKGDTNEYQRKLMRERRRAAKAA